MATDAAERGPWRGLVVVAATALGLGALDVFLGIGATSSAGSWRDLVHLVAVTTAAFWVVGAVAALAARVLLRSVARGPRLAGVAALMAALWGAVVLDRVLPGWSSPGERLVSLAVVLAASGAVLRAAAGSASAAVSAWTTALALAAVAALGLRALAAHPATPDALGPSVLLGRAEGVRPAVTLAFTVALGLVAVGLARLTLGRGRHFASAAVVALSLTVVVVGLTRGERPAFADRRGTPGAAPTGSVRHVVLIVVDTLRRDRLACYSPGAPPTPALDALAADSLRFDEARAAAPWTLPSMTSLMTGAPPDVHLATKLYGTVPRSLPTVAERFGAAGYRTAAIGENVHLLPGAGMERGFDEYDWHPVPRPAPPFASFLRERLGDRSATATFDGSHLTERAVEWVDAHADEDFFLWLHYFDPHLPYSPPPDLVPEGPSLPDVGASFSDLAGVRHGHVARDAPSRARVAQLYDAEVRSVDRHVGRFLAHLRARGLYDDTLIVLTSDHGEELWDHGRFEHGHTLYDELLRVPLLLKLPGSASTGLVEGPVSLTSVAPTMLALAGVDAGDRPALAAPFWPLDPRAQREDDLFTGTLYFSESAALFDGRWKYVVREADGREELFDLDQDPLETRSLVHQRPEELVRLRARLTARRDAAAELRERLGIVPSERTRDRGADATLRALGYSR